VFLKLILIQTTIFTGQTQAKMKTGIVDKANSHLQPKVGMIMSANKTSKQAPRAQKL